MPGLLDLDVLCFEKIFKFLKPLDLWSLRQSCTQLQNFVDDYFRSLYLAQEQWLDLRAEDTRNVDRILTNFGKFVRYLNVREETSRQNLLLEVILTNCGALKGLSLNNLFFHKTDVEKFAGVFDNLQFLQLFHCNGDQQCVEQFLLGHEYPNLTTLNVIITNVGTEVFQKFFMKKRNIRKLHLRGEYINSDILPLIVLNAAELEELDIHPESGRNLQTLAQLRKLKRLEVYCVHCDQISIISLIKELSVNNQLEKLGILDFEFTNEFSDALRNLTNLKELRFWGGRYTLNSTILLEMLCRKLSKLESLMLVHCLDFPYRNFLASACKSGKFRTITIDARQINSFIEQMVKDFIDGRSHRCFVVGEPLCIYLEEHTFFDMRELLTQNNLQSVEKYGNIKILRAISNAFCFGY